MAASHRKRTTAAMGIRACSRLTGLNPRTVLSILETAGEHCARLLENKVRNVKSQNVQVDEIHTFVGCKAQRTTRDDMERGDFFTYLSVDRDTKLIINWRTSKRDGENTLAFMQDLKSRMDGRFQLTTDAYPAYWRRPNIVGDVFGNQVDYATETKVFGKKFSPSISQWKNPLVVINIKRQRRIGDADLTMATTCHVERTNLTVRTFTKRFTRATICYSKKLENLRHAVALFVAHFNFCRVHSAHNKTPAQESGLTDHTWTVKDLLSQNN
jgi:IS1 family transposase